MPAPASVDEYVEFVRRSGVADESALAARLADYAADPPATPADMAAALLRDGVLTRFQSEQILQGRFRRFTIGKYKILERLGSGGMGQVFLCEHKLMRRRVAIKVLPASQAKSPSSLERFYREARAVAAVDHPNIVRAYDIDQDGDLHFLVMEHVDGVNLHDLVRKAGPLPVGRACHYVAATCVGLEHSLEVGLIHRDIKPANVLVDRSGTVKILDMGLAKFFEEDDSLTKQYDDNILGTADYLAPEQALDSTDVDIRADIYALGGTLYYLLAGRPPFPEGSVAQKLLFHQQREPTPLRELRPDVPEALAAVVSKMMAKDRDARYQRPAHVVEALRPWTADPLPPPSSDELPAVSLAARAVGGSVSSRAAARPPLHAQETGVTAASVTPAAGTAPPAVASPAAPAEWSADAAWASFTADDRPPVPRSRATTALPSELARPPRPLALKHLVVAAAGGFLAVLAVGLTVALWPRGLESVPPAPGAWYVSRAGDGPDAERTLKTLAGALDRAGPGETVYLLDAEMDDPPVRLSDAGKGAKAGVTVRPGPGLDAVRWTPRHGGKAAGPALELAYTDGVTVRGLVIDLQGLGECGLAASAASPGLLVEGVTVLNPRVSGFRFQGVRATAERPATLRGCRVAGVTRYHAGVTILSGASHLAVADNRLEGPAEVGVELVGHADAVDLRGNRVWQCDTALSLRGKLVADRPYRVRFAHNTVVAAADAAVRCTHPLTGQQELDLDHNYFAATPVLLRGVAGTPTGLKATDNARDAAGDDKSLKATAVPATLPTDVNNDAAFLRSPKVGKYGSQLQ